MKARCDTCGDPVFAFAWTVWCLMWKCIGWHHAKRDGAA
jgi:hypothetical protein